MILILDSIKCVNTSEMKFVWREPPLSVFSRLVWLTEWRPHHISHLAMHMCVERFCWVWKKIDFLSHSNDTYEHSTADYIQSLSPLNFCCVFRIGFDRFSLIEISMRSLSVMDKTLRCHFNTVHLSRHFGAVVPYLISHTIWKWAQPWTLPFSCVAWWSLTQKYFIGLSRK